MTDLRTIFLNPDTLIDGWRVRFYNYQDTPYSDHDARAWHHDGQAKRISG